MNEDTTTEEEKQEYISVIERRANGLQHLIQAFYDLSRLESNKHNMNIEDIDINKELKEQLLVFYNDFEKNNINVELDLFEEQIYIQGDKNSIERVFTNLIQNSIKYSKTTFKVFSAKKDTEIIFIFANDIQGLKKEDEALLFNRFYMKDNSRNNQSSGLGLTITKLLVESMGGDIESKIEENWIEFKVKFMLK